MSILICSIFAFGCAPLIFDLATTGGVRAQGDVFNGGDEPSAPDTDGSPGGYQPYTAPVRVPNSNPGTPNLDQSFANAAASCTVVAREHESRPSCSGAALVNWCLQHLEDPDCPAIVAQGGQDAGQMKALPLGAGATPRPANQAKVATKKSASLSGVKLKPGAQAYVTDNWGPNAVEKGPDLLVTNPQGIQFSFPLTRLIDDNGQQVTAKLKNFSFSTNLQTPYAAGNYVSQSGALATVTGTMVSSTPAR
jgi:hypothetical protein